MKNLNQVNLCPGPIFEPGTSRIRRRCVHLTMTFGLKLWTNEQQSATQTFGTPGWGHSHASWSWSKGGGGMARNQGGGFKSSKEREAAITGANVRMAHAVCVSIKWADSSERNLSDLNCYALNIPPLPKKQLAEPTVIKSCATFWKPCYKAIRSNYIPSRNHIFAVLNLIGSILGPTWAI
jgi:hypothetical protein